jgi:acetylornithine deacetylase
VQAGGFLTHDLQGLLERLVAIDSVNPTLVPGGAGEAALARFVAKWLEERGIAADYAELGPRRANVVARVRGTGGGRSLLLNAHLDTVGLGGADGGVQPRVDGSRLYGRGAYDMKASLAAIMLVAAAAAERRLAGDVIVAAVADEESHSIGSERVAESVDADAAIVAEPTELQIAIAHKGFVWLELETRGRAAHGSRYDLGVDAIARMGRTLVALGELDERLGDAEHPLLGRPSIHASLIEGGQELSTYPDRCVVQVERRTLPGETIESVEEQLRALDGDARVKTLFARQPLETRDDEPIVQLLAKHANTELVGVPFWTDAALFAAAGIPTVVFGPSGAGAHEDTEWVDLDSAKRAAEILLAVTTDFCA